MKNYDANNKLQTRHFKTSSNYNYKGKKLKNTSNKKSKGYPKKNSAK